MEKCECGEPKFEHHPSFHYAVRRDEIMLKVEAFMGDIYPAGIFGESFNRKQVALIAACYILDNGLDRQGRQP